MLLCIAGGCLCLLLTLKVPGCSSCGDITVSHWSMLLGRLPVSSVALGVYAALLICLLALTDRELSPVAGATALILSGAIAGSALWFMAVQAWIIGSWCRLCVADHIVGLLVSALTIRMIRIKMVRKLLLFIVGLGLAAIMAAAQYSSRPVIDKDSYKAIFEESPLLGNQDARYKLILIYDEQCPQCIKVRGMAEEIVNEYPDRMAFALCPSTAVKGISTVPMLVSPGKGIVPEVKDREEMVKLIEREFGMVLKVSGDSPAYGDVRYAPKRKELQDEGSTSDRLLDIYLPDTPRPAQGYPVILYVHGGGFHEGDKRKNHIVFDPLVKLGYAVVTVNYYLYAFDNEINKQTWGSELPYSPPAGGRYAGTLQAAVDAATEDAVLALKWVRKNASVYGLDKSRIALYGGSAGAMTIINMAYNIRPRRPRIRAVVNLWGAIDDPARIRRGDPPMLTIHGDRDDLVSVDFAYEIQERMDQLGIGKSRFILMKGRRHAQYKYVSTDLIPEIDSFLRACLF
ncbi:MAG: carboxylesterase family protein [Bacteroidales bacterium]|nr:carboxylesterase family protein [Bacteroidales bacterium]